MTSSQMLNIRVNRPSASDLEHKKDAGQGVGFGSVGLYLDNMLAGLVTHYIYRMAYWGGAVSLASEESWMSKHWHTGHDGPYIQPPLRIPPRSMKSLSSAFFHFFNHFFFGGEF